MADELDRQARELGGALSEVIRLYQFRERDRICVVLRLHGA